MNMPEYKITWTGTANVPDYWGDEEITRRAPIGGWLIMNLNDDDQARELLADDGMDWLCDVDMIAPGNHWLSAADSRVTCGTFSFTGEPEGWEPNEWEFNQATVLSVSPVTMSMTETARVKLYNNAVSVNRGELDQAVRQRRDDRIMSDPTSWKISSAQEGASR